MILAIAVTVLGLAAAAWLFLWLTPPEPDVPFIDRDGFQIPRGSEGD